MEKVLRRVSVKDGLPEKDGSYYVSDYGKDELYKIIIYPDIQKDMEWVKNMIEYWYEEMSLEELAKERHDKALNFLSYNDKFNVDNAARKALKIAAGIEEDEI